MHTPSDTRNIIGTALARYRNARGWSQNELAAKCQVAGWDISRGIIAGIEGRVRWVGDWEVMLLVSVLKISVADLLVHAADPFRMIKLVGPGRRTVKARPQAKRRAKRRRRS